jgi:hypothetical protein
MTSFRTWLRSSPCRKRPPDPRRTARLELEPLEDRQLLSTVTYHGGPLLTRAEVENVFYGPSWSASLAGQQGMIQLNTFMKTLVNSPYMDQLAAYNQGSYHIGRGRLSGSATSAYGFTDTTTFVTEKMVTDMLDYEIQHGLAEPDANRLYMVYLPANVGFADIGHHGAFRDSAGDVVYYAIVPDQSDNLGRPLGSTDGLTAFDQKTWITSHELVEAITDPGAYTGLVPDGWHGDFAESEIGDIPQERLPAGQVEGNLYGYDVQRVWIEPAGDSLLPSGLPVWQGVNQPRGFRSITLATQPNGLEAEFAIGTDWMVWTRSQHLASVGPPTKYWGSWISLGRPGPASTGSLQVGHNADGSLEVFVVAPNYIGIGSTYLLWTRTQTAPNATTFGSWQNLGGPTGSLLSLAVANNANGTEQIFALGADHRVYTAQQQLVWNPLTHKLFAVWNPLSGAPLSSLGNQVLSMSVAADANRRLNIFTLGLNGSVATMVERAANSPAWTGLTSLGGWVQSVTAARNADGSLEVFCLGFDGAVYTKSQLGGYGLGGWSDWVDLGGWVRSITVGQNKDGRLEVFAVGQDYQVYSIAQTAPKLTSGPLSGPTLSVEPAEWTWWFGLGGTARSLNVGTTTDGRLEVFALDGAGMVQTAAQTAANGGWN